MAKNIIFFSSGRRIDGVYMAERAERESIGERAAGNNIKADRIRFKKPGMPNHPNALVMSEIGELLDGLIGLKEQ